MQPNKRENNESPGRTIGRHIVALAFRQRCPAETYGTATDTFNSSLITCFVISIGGDWYLVTVGHALDGIRQAIDAKAEFPVWRILDCAGGEATYTDLPPFAPFNGSADLYIFQNGKDFAFIKVPDNARTLMSANSVYPIPEESIFATIPVDTVDSLVIGFPLDLVDFYWNRDSLKVELTSIALLNVRQPSGRTDLLEAELYDFRQHNDNLSSIVGMSGGPWIQYWQDGATGLIAYKPVAIQSSWEPQTMTATAYSLTEAVQHFKQWLASQ
ncbi:hypothetical protein EON83_25780 [bacterium]|nr:MAG: hypothetical protein EON83_25780 [bacterium]